MILRDDLQPPVTTHHITYYEGDIPLIFSAPHGGEEMPDSIADRTQGVMEQDEQTLELSRAIITAFQELTGKTPYAILAQISRTKVDLNRKEPEAYDDPAAKIVYDEFHHRIQQAEREIDRTFGKGLYIDIHGQSHPKGYLEFGYLLVNDTLKLHDTRLVEHQEVSSIRTLSRFSPETFLEQLKGPHSLGSLMCREGHDSVPSIKLPYATDDNYFEGAYDTIRYGSLGGGNISGIQIEFPYANIRDSEENIKKCTHAFARSVLRFMEVHLGVVV